MSKIAEKIHDTALKKGEEYSKSHGGSVIEEVAYGRGYKTAYIECYDQAMKDFIGKAENWLAIHMPFGEVSHELKCDCIKEFKNHMQKED